MSAAIDINTAKTMIAEDAEILRKHVQGPPDGSDSQQTVGGVTLKSLARNQADLQATVDGMVAQVEEAVELAGNAATTYMSFATTEAMDAFTTAEDNQTAYNAETDSYYRWDEGGSAWVFVRIAENSRITAVEARVIPTLIDDDYTVTGTNEVLDIDTTEGIVTVNLKATPPDRARVTFTDIKGQFANNALVVVGNGKTIGGTATSVRCREAVPMTFTLEFDAAADTWRLFATT